MVYDLIIIGGGPAGVGAGVYAARKRLKTVFITKDFLSQSAVSDNIQNWIGAISISGSDFVKNLENHLRSYALDSVDLKIGETALSVNGNQGNFSVKTDKSSYLAKVILIATGSRRKKLKIDGADKFDNKGVSYCASCDGPLFGGQDVAVIGGGNAAFESAAQLLAYAKSVTLLNRSDRYRADEVTINRLSNNPKFKALKNSMIVEINGDKFVSSLKYKNALSQEIKSLSISGIFVEIGSEPNTSLVKNLIKLNDWGNIVVDPETQKTSLPGIWAAGDCANGKYQQNNIAAGDGIKALEDIYIHLHAK